MDRARARLLSSLTLLALSFSPEHLRAETEATVAIDHEIQAINDGLVDGDAVALPPVCRPIASDKDTNPSTAAHRCAAWEFTQVFRDSSHRVRKITEWADGISYAAVPVASWRTQQVRSTRRTVDWYYDAGGHPIFVAARYQGQPASGFQQQQVMYLKDGQQIEQRFALNDQVPAVFVGPCAIHGDLSALAREKLSVVEAGPAPAEKAQ